MQVRKERNIRGQTHAFHYETVDDIATTVRANILSNGSDPRNLSRTMKDTSEASLSAVVGAHRCTEQRPPALPRARDVLASLPAKQQQSGGVAPGIPALLVPADGSQSRRDSRLERIVAPLPRNTVEERPPEGLRSTLAGGNAPVIHAADSSPSQRRPSPHVSPMPRANAFPDALPVSMRILPSHHSTTFQVVQPVASEHNAMYATPQDQFDPVGRGLCRTLALQKEKLQKLASVDLKVERRRAMEAAVIASRAAEGQRMERMREGRIRSKGEQLQRYQERLSKYKFTQ